VIAETQQGRLELARAEEVECKKLALEFGVGLSSLTGSKSETNINPVFISI
jgi:hypothetical protein